MESIIRRLLRRLKSCCSICIVLLYEFFWVGFLRACSEWLGRLDLLLVDGNRRGGKSLSDSLSGRVFGAVFIVFQGYKSPLACFFSLSLWFT